jgi:hypothetical protein
MGRFSATYLGLRSCAFIGPPLTQPSIELYQTCYMAALVLIVLLLLVPSPLELVFSPRIVEFIHDILFASV